MRVLCAVAAAAGVCLVRPGTRAVAASSTGTGAATVMALGDSITYGRTGPDLDTPGGYRGYLAQDAAGFGGRWAYVGSLEDNAPLNSDPARFRQEGHPGYRIDQIAAGLDGPDVYPGATGGDWLSGSAAQTPVRPDIVILHIGTNDIAQAYDPQGRYPDGYNSADPGQRAQFVAHLAARLEGLLAEIQRLDPGARVVLCTITPMGTTAPDPTAHAYDDAIRSTVLPWERSRGVAVALADVEAAFLSNPGTYHELVGPDGVHPTPEGYATMAQVIAPAVQTLLQRGRG